MFLKEIKLTNFKCHEDISLSFENQAGSKQPIRKTTFLLGENGTGKSALAPYIEDPAEYYTYLPILANKEVLVVPAKEEYLPVVQASEKIFGINRKELLDLRFQWYCFYMTFRRTLTVANLPDDIRRDNQDRINEMVEDRSPYAGMIRAFELMPLEDLPWDANLRITESTPPKPRRKRN